MKKNIVLREQAIEPLEIETPKGTRRIGPGFPCFIVAEVSGNHNGSIETAKAIIRAAADAGADAVKLQTYTPDTLTIDSDKKWFRVEVNDAWAGLTLHELYQRAHTPWEWHDELMRLTRELGLFVFSTPFDDTAVDFLERLGASLYKVASFEAADVSLLKKIASTKKPVILSRGLQPVDDIQMAIDLLRSHGTPSLAVLHCISQYPAPLETMNVATVADIARRFGVVAGLSDHSVGIAASVAAVALGASIIEKHVTLSRAAGGVDAAFSLEPSELKQLVSTIRDVETAIGMPTYEAGSQERENVVFKRSIFAIRDIRAGNPFTTENVRIIRPGYGLAPKFIDEVLGAKAVRDIERGTPLSWELTDKNLQR